jgi:hypothetical protein
MPHHIREAAKRAVVDRIPDRRLGAIPYVTGIGIGEGHVKVTITQPHYLHKFIPSELPGGLSVLLEEQPRHRRHARRKRGSGEGACHLFASQPAGPLQGGMPLIDQDTAFGILVDLSGNKFIVGAAHSFAFLKAGTIVYKGQKVGQFTKTALTCGQTANHLDASIGKVAAGVVTSSSILGLGVPNGFAEPVIGEHANMQGAYGGRRTGIVTTINYTFKDDYGGEGNYPKTCPVTHQDMFQVKNKSGIDGDSGAAVWNDAGFLTGLHFDGLDAAGNLGTNCKATYLTPELGVH